MDYFKSRSLYQEIEPVPRRGQKKLLHYALIGAVSVCLGTVMIFVLVNSFGRSPSATDPEIDGSNDSSANQVLRGSAPKYILGAPAPEDTTPTINHSSERPSQPTVSDVVAASGSTASPIQTKVSDVVAPSGSTPKVSDVVAPSGSTASPVQPKVSDVVTSSSPRPPDASGSPVASSSASNPPSSTSSGTTTTTQPPPPEVIVDLELGSVLGRRMNSRAGREYLAFLGIPYAKPPLRELRFQPPVVPEAWNGTLNATYFQPDCLQKDKYNAEFVTKGDEDCLYVNIYTPKTLEDLKKRFDFRRFPVMVYIHGGGQYGSATRYGAEYFMDEDVVLVTLHYRLGVLGNLNTNDTNARGNQGLKDQVMALQWVQDNIQKLGGSSRKVTIFGNSYGGMEVTSHMLSPMSKGLFKRAISQSGTELVPFVFTKDPLKSAVELGKILNCTGNSSAVVSCFRNVDAKELILTSYLMDFGTSVEPPGNNTEAEDVFLSDTPVNILQSGQINRVTSMFGVVSGEGLFASLPILSNQDSTDYFDENWETEAIAALKLNNSVTLKDPERIANAARDFYLGNNSLSRDVEANFTAMFSDRQFVHPVNVFATFQLGNQSTGGSRGGSGGRGGRGRRGRRENVYLYYFNEEADKSYADNVLTDYGTDEFLGAGHADELQFLFPYDPYPTYPLSSQHANFSQMMVRMWVSFANTGKPTGADNGVEWEPITNEKPYRWFELTTEPQMIDFLGDRMEFWDSFNLTDLYV